MKRDTIFAIIALLIAVFLVIGWEKQTCLFVQGEKGIISCLPARGDMKIKIRFIHSVQKTPVEEFLRVDPDLQGITLDYTRYRSFGVGLPFMMSDGEFRREGDYFIMDGMDRHFPALSLRTGKGTELTVTVDNIEYPLYKKFKPGYRVDIYTAPRFRGLINWFKN